MAEEFNTDGMLEMFLYESEQLLENLQNIVLEKKMKLLSTKMISMRYSVPCIPLKAHPGL